MINYVALGFYLFILLSLTFIASRNESQKDFLIASRDVTWQCLGLSIFASVISSYNIVVSLSFSYILGPWVLLVYIGALLGFATIYYLVKKGNIDASVRKNFNSIIDFLIDKFGCVNASFFNLSFILVLFLFISMQFFVNTAIFSQLMGWNKYTSTLVVSTIVFMYIAKGGLKVEILTDVVQGILMFLFIVLLFFVDTSNLTKGTIIPLLKNNALLFSALCIGIAQFLTLLVQPDMWQKIYASKSSYDLKKSIIFSSILVLIFIIPIIILGLSVRAKGLINSPDMIFYDILKTATPEWFLPVISVSLFAAFMSSLDSSLFALATQIGKYGFWIKEKVASRGYDENKAVKNIKKSLFFITIITSVVSLYFSDFLTQVMQLISLLTINAVVILSGILFKLPHKEVLISLLLGITIFVIFAFSNIISAEPYTVLYPSVVVILYIVVQHIFLSLYQKRK